MSSTTPNPGRRCNAIGALAAVMVVLTASSCLGNVVDDPPKPLDTPEATIHYFIDRVRAEDYDGALGTCAVDGIAEHYDYAALIDWLHILSPTAEYLPSEYGLFVAGNRHAVEHHILQQLSWMALSVALPEPYAPFLEMYPLRDTEVDFDQVVQDMDPRRFLGIEIAEIGMPALLSNAGHVEILGQQASIHGAEAATSRAVLYTVAGKYYVGGVRLLQYDGVWRIWELSDPLLEQSYSGALIPVDGPSTFETMLE